MSLERQGNITEVTTIRIKREEGSLTFIFEANDTPVAQLSLPALGSLSFQTAPEAAHPESGPVAPEQPNSAPVPAELRESRRTITLSGRLKTQPRSGRPDRSGKPTAYARFAAHVEGEPEAHDYLATFHRHTTRIALGLAKEAQLTVEGYAHPKANPDAKGLDTFSVISLVNYPGKRQSQGQ